MLKISAKSLSFILPFLTILAASGCIPINRKVDITEQPHLTKNLEFKATQDSILFIAKWAQTEKLVIGMSDSLASQFAFSRPIIRALIISANSSEYLTFQQINLGGNQHPEIFISFENSTEAFLYQKSSSDNHWQLIWRGIGDAGNEPKIFGEGIPWISTLVFQPCSSCGIIEENLYHIDQDSVIYAGTFMASQSFDHEDATEEETLQETFNANVYPEKKGLTVDFHFEFSELSTRTTFISNKIHTYYEWIDSTNTLNLIHTNPKFLLNDAHGKKTPKSDSDNFNIIGNELFIALFKFQENCIVALKKLPQLNELIKRIEISYEESWDKLIKSWISQHSFIA